MKIAYLHYHLKPGGVTSVIRHQVQSLPPEAAPLVLSGETPPTRFPATVVTLPGIGSDGTAETAQTAGDMAAAIDRAIAHHFGGAGRCDLIHLHNPTLANNSQMLAIIRHLQRRGYALLLQIHDFAEDGRPSAYYRDAAYPRDCHYSVINQRDYGILKSSGLDPQGLHYLPNCIPPAIRPIETARDAGFILLPVRAIRRKNIGEALLLSLCLSRGCEIYITLPPNSPSDFPSYRHWQQLVKICNLPVRFEMGLNKAFATLVQECRHVISTSISEGFGFAYLEPWTAGKSLEGRLIPDICRDFSDAGVRLDHLYPRLRIPVTWIGYDRLIERFQACYRRICRSYGVTSQIPSARTFTAPIEKMDAIDFGLLDEPLQTLVIRSVLADTEKLRRLRELNPPLTRLGRIPRSRRRMEHNREIILKKYSLSAYGEALQTIYHKVINHAVRHGIDKFKLLRQFIDFDTFSLLKWNPFSEDL